MTKKTDIAKTEKAASAAPPAPTATAAARKTTAKTKTAKPVKNTAKPTEPHGKKPKLVRDSFTLPESDYAIFKELKNRCLASGVEAKKSALLRVALITLAKCNDAELVEALNALPPIKTGRPAKKS